LAPESAQASAERGKLAEKSGIFEETAKGRLGCFPSGGRLDDAFWTNDLPSVVMYGVAAGTSLLFMAMRKKLAYFSANDAQ